MKINEILGPGFKPLEPDANTQPDREVTDYSLVIYSDIDDQAILKSRSLQSGGTLYKLVISSGITTMIFAEVDREEIDPFTHETVLKSCVSVTDFVTPSREGFPTVLVPSKFERN